MRIRPFTDWIVVKFDPLKKRSGIIEISGDNDTSAIRTGTVVSTGPGKPNRTGGFNPMEVQEGARICFFRWHQEHRPGKQISSALEKMSTEFGGDIMMIRLSDVLFEFHGDISVDIV